MSKLTKVCAIQKGYFKDSSDEIAARNLKLMRTTGYVGMVVYALYLALTILFFKRLEISLLYGLIVPVLLLFLLYANRALKTGNVNVRQAQRVTLLLYIVLMLYMLVMSVFPHPNVPSVYYPLFLMMAPVLFILPSYQHIVINISSLIVFFVLVFNFKSSVCWMHELFEAVTATIFSMVVVVFMTQFRIQSDSLKEKYYALSRQDLLTGVVNKTAGMEAAQAYLDTMAKDEYCALLFVDIDNFKRYNDTYGHLEGDQMLRNIGATLSRLCRKGDIACRFGGDEFILLLKDIHTATVAEQRAGDMIQAITGLSDEDKQPITCSVGICVCRNDIRNIEDVIHRADIALYYAKCNGKNRFATYREELVK